MYKKKLQNVHAKLGLASAVCAAMLQAQPAVAQVAALLEEVTVTAQYREQNLQETPLSITAVSAEMMEARNQTSIEDVAAQAPNVSLNTMGGAFGPSVSSFIRGVGQYDFNPAYEPGVGMYVDDVYYASLTGANFDLLDLERVEILRGPQGTLTGRNSIGGAIKLFTRKPSGEGNGYVEGTYGSRHRLDIRAGGDFKITDNLFGRISGVYKRQDGFIDRIDYGCANPGNAEGIAALRAGGNCTLDKMGDEGYSGLRATLRWTPSETLDVMFSSDYTNIERSGAADVLVSSNLNPNYLCGDRCNYVNYSNAEGALPKWDTTPETTYSGFGYSLNVDWSLSETLQLTSITSYRTYETAWGTDDDFTPDLTVSAAGYNDMDHDFFSQEFRVNGSINDNIQYTVGAYYSDQKTVYFTMQDIRYFGPLQFMGNDPVDADSKAVFGTLIYSLTDDLTVTAGARRTEESKDYQFVRKTWDGTGPAPIVGALDGVVASYEGAENDYRVAVDYKLSDNTMIYGSWSTGFKGGGVTARPFTVNQALNGSFDPEKMKAYEIGVKTSPFENATLNVSVFKNDYTDKQMPLASCAELDGVPGFPCAAIQNAGDGTLKGIEAEFTALFGNLAVDASLSYLNTEWSNIAEAVGGSYQLDDPMTFLSPERRLSLGVQYDFDLGEGGMIYTRVDGTYDDKIFAGRVGGDPTYFPSKTVVNARIAWRNAEGNLDISLQGKNLTDEDRPLYLFSAVTAFTGTTYQTLGDPREWALTVKRSF